MFSSFGISKQEQEENRDTLLQVVEYQKGVLKTEQDQTQPRFDDIGVADDDVLTNVEVEIDISKVKPMSPKSPKVPARAKGVNQPSKSKLVKTFSGLKSTKANVAPKQQKYSPKAPKRTIQQPSTLPPTKSQPPTPGKKHAPPPPKRPPLYGSSSTGNLPPSQQKPVLPVIPPYKQKPTNQNPYPPARPAKPYPGIGGSPIAKQRPESPHPKPLPKFTPKPKPRSPYPAHKPPPQPIKTPPSNQFHSKASAPVLPVAPARQVKHRSLSPRSPEEPKAAPVRNPSPTVPKAFKQHVCLGDVISKEDPRTIFGELEVIGQGYDGVNVVFN